MPPSSGWQWNVSLLQYDYTALYIPEGCCLQKQNIYKTHEVIYQEGYANVCIFIKLRTAHHVSNS
jgi:hypothetical protein